MTESKLQTEVDRLNKKLDEFQEVGCVIENDDGYVCSFVRRNTQLCAENEKMKKAAHKIFNLLAKMYSDIKAAEEEFGKALEASNQVDETG